MKTIIIASNNANKAREIKQILKLEDCEFLTLKEAGLSADPDENADTYLGNARIKALAVKGAVMEVLAGSTSARGTGDNDGRKECLGSSWANSDDVFVLADDSGLEVDALGGAPGVHSARYAGVDATDSQNNEKLLHEMRDVPEDKRSARFMCQLVMLRCSGAHGERDVEICACERDGGNVEICARERDGGNTEVCVYERDKNSTEICARGVMEISARGVMEISARGVMEGRIAFEECGGGGFGYDPLFLPEAVGYSRSAAELTAEEKNAISHRSCALRNLNDELERREL